ncbi:MAG: chemotaxis signal transduction protein [Promethearchaeota archaeon CR_4]|nr:MAG: chemotaxis signal transduction protein [Candidatus Lokiarchaeota archaeon CR_4]
MFKFTPSEEKNEFLGFLVDKEYYSIGIENVQEIITVPPITRVPNTPRYVEGALNLRGKVIKIVNIRKKLELPFKHYDGNTRIIILNAKNITIGIIVDQILEVFKVDKDNKAELPKLFRNESKIGYADKIIRNGEKLYINFDFNKISVEV